MTRLTLLFVLLAADASAQAVDFRPAPPPSKTSEPVCVVCPVVEPFQREHLRAFDFGLHGFNFAVRAIVQDGPHTLLLAYEPSLRAAVLVDVRTGWGQFVRPFNAGIADSDRGPIVFDDVAALDRRTFAWWHRGAVWSDQWDEKLKLYDFKAFPIGAGLTLPLFRFR